MRRKTPGFDLDLVNYQAQLINGYHPHDPASRIGNLHAGS